MIRVFTKTLGVILTILLGIFVLLLILLHTSSSDLNSSLKRQASAHPLLREIFQLHSYGDGRADYLLARYRLISVEIDYLRGYAPGAEVRSELEADLERLTGKQVEVRLDEELPGDVRESYSTEDLLSISARHRRVKTSGDQAGLYILSMTRSKDHKSNVGETLDENSFALFSAEVRSLPDYRADQIKLEESTMLHEFGHLLGLEHSGSGVMAEEVEVLGGDIDPSNYWFSGEDLAKIEALRKKYSQSR